MSYAQYEASQNAVPLLFTAQPGGIRLAAFLRELATKDDSPPSEAWAALRCLPHACEKPDQARLYAIFLYYGSDNRADLSCMFGSHALPSHGALKGFPVFTYAFDVHVPLRSFKTGLGMWAQQHGNEPFMLPMGSRRVCG